MATGKTGQRNISRDRGRVAGQQGYELGYFARKHGISRQQAQQLISRVGNNREKLNAAAAKLKGRQQG